MTSSKRLCRENPDPGRAQNYVKGKSPGGRGNGTDHHSVNQEQHDVRFLLEKRPMIDFFKGERVGTEPGGTRQRPSSSDTKMAGDLAT